MWVGYMSRILCNNERGGSQLPKLDNRFKKVDLFCSQLLIRYQLPAWLIAFRQVAYEVDCYTSNQQGG